MFSRNVFLLRSKTLNVMGLFILKVCNIEQGTKPHKIFKSNVIRQMFVSFLPATFSVAIWVNKPVIIADLTNLNSVRDRHLNVVYAVSECLELLYKETFKWRSPHSVSSFAISAFFLAVWIKYKGPTIVNPVSLSLPLPQKLITIWVQLFLE